MKEVISKFFLISFVVLFSGCASKVMDYEHMEKLEENKEYEQMIQVKELPDEESGKSLLDKQGQSPQEEKQKSSQDSGKKNSEKKKAETKKESKKIEEAHKDKKIEKKMTATKSKKKEPDYEDSENFIGRRPVKDPFRVGEKIRLSMTYFNITAGYMDLMVKPFVEVNGEKAYHFEVDIQSNSFFSRIYTVDDKATTYMNYENLLPYNLDIKVRESKQVKEIRSVIDNKTLKGSYWEKKATKEKGEKERRVQWDIKPFSQNVISAVYYLRNFTLTPGKKLQFRVADDGKNYMFKGEVLRREKLDTEIGELNTVVVKPEISLQGAFKPVGDILIWLTDDDRKFVVRIESKIKIGTIVAKLKSLERGIE
ncbi:MAG: DUF3108 domain-containing protein [Bdellovibrionales bacterium]|nr:DUF3108 domain-containing protein [Bdellovibrionales bacterium]